MSSFVGKLPFVVGAHERLEYAGDDDDPVAVGPRVDAALGGGMDGDGQCPKRLDALEMRSCRVDAADKGKRGVADLVQEVEHLLHVDFQRVAVVLGRAVAELRADVVGAGRRVMRAPHDALLEDVFEFGAGVSVDGVRRVEEELGAGNGADAHGARVERLDVVGAVELGVDVGGLRGGVHAVSEHEEHVVEVVRGGVVDGAVLHPAPLSVAELPGPAVAREIPQGPSPEDAGAEPDRGAEASGEDVRLQPPHDGAERPLVADAHEGAAAPLGLGHAVGVGQRAGEGLLAQHGEAVGEQFAGLVGMEADGGGDAGAIGHVPCGEEFANGVADGGAVGREVRQPLAAGGRGIDDAGHGRKALVAEFNQGFDVVDAVSIDGDQQHGWHLHGPMVQRQRIPRQGQADPGSNSHFGESAPVAPAWRPAPARRAWGKPSAFQHSILAAAPRRTEIFGRYSIFYMNM